HRQGVFISVSWTGSAPGGRSTRRISVSSGRRLPRSESAKSSAPQRHQPTKECVSCFSASSRCSSECKRKRLHARVEELDREGAVTHPAFLAHQLVEPLARDDAGSFSLRIHSSVAARHLSIQRDPETDRLAGGGAEHEVEVARVEAEADLRA